MVETILFILNFVLAGFSGAYFECERLVLSGKWKDKDHTGNDEDPNYVLVPFWNKQINIGPFTLKTDSYHFMFGLTVALFIIYTLLIVLGVFQHSWIHPFVFFWGFWWWRNVGMHVVFVEDNRWWYWFPPPIAGMVADFRKKKNKK